MSLRILSGGVLAASLFVLAPSAPAQTFNPGLTDPDEIAQECGGDAVAGRLIYETDCAACHALAPDAGAGKGPHLQGLYGSVAGTRDGWDFSGALRLAGAGGLTWEPQTLHVFLTDPAARVPGMLGVHPAIASEQDRRDLMTYLRTNTLPPPPALDDVVIPAAVWQITPDPAYGEYLAGDCMSCHSESASAASDLKILGSDGARAFVEALYHYKARARQHDVMEMVAGTLGDEEIVSLAAYFAELNGK